MSQLMAVPYVWNKGNPIKNAVILDAVVKHPYWFSAPSTADERRKAAAWLLTSPENLTWEVWRGGDLVGILLLWRVSPKVDALFHFVFFDQNLVGKRTLLVKFLGYCFTELGFRRLTMEVPEFVRTLISFARRKLGFHFEGENRTVDHPAVQALGSGTTGRMQHPNLWVAQQGSRREGAHWHNGTWHDVICLRLTAEEYSAFIAAGGKSCQPQLSAPSPLPSSEPQPASSLDPSSKPPKPLSPRISKDYAAISSTS